MARDPAEIDRVELRTRPRAVEFIRGRRAGRRAAADGAVSPASRWPSHLDDSLKFMHVSAPVRVMDRAEWARSGCGEFGLDPPGYTAGSTSGTRG